MESAVAAARAAGPVANGTTAMEEDEPPAKRVSTHKGTIRHPAKKALAVLALLMKGRYCVVMSHSPVVTADCVAVHNVGTRMALQHGKGSITKDSVHNMRTTMSTVMTARASSWRGKVHGSYATSQATRVCISQAKAGITKEIVDQMMEQSKVLSKGRKKRVMPEGLASVDDIEKFGLLSSHPLHKSTKVSSPFHTGVDCRPARSAQTCKLRGGLDQAAGATL